MRITVITVCYNARDTIRDTIESVQSQTWKDVEHIIVDGGSDDGTLDIIDEYRNGISKLINGPDQGIYHAMNKGIRVATGDVIGTLNADDVYENEQVLEWVASLMDDKEGYEGVYGDLAYVERENLDCFVRFWKAGSYERGAFKRGWMPPHPTFFVKRSVYEKFGLFRTELWTSADYEIMLRFIHRYGIKLAYLPETLIRMRSGGQSNISLKNRMRAHKEDRLAWEMNGLKKGWLTLVWKPLSKVHQFIRGVD